MSDTQEEYIADELSRIAGQFKRFNDLKEVGLVLEYGRDFFTTMDQVKKQKQERYDDAKHARRAE